MVASNDFADFQRKETNIIRRNYRKEETPREDPVSDLMCAMARDLRRYERLGGDMENLSIDKVYSLIERADGYSSKKLNLGIRGDRYERAI